LLSVLQAALTLPGIAGIVLTVGMAVDANVLIFERIREELANSNSPQASIRAGYDKAFSTIADANITTLIAALVLFAFGTGPIKGFAVTLALGILTSMFTAIVGTRAVVNLVYGGRRVQRLAIGGRASHAAA
jgi:preprotein translocase subunit SecD